MSPQNNIIHVALATPLRHHFDYLPRRKVGDGSTLRIGMRVLVRLAAKKKWGL